MTTVEIIIIALGLSMDISAVSLAAAAAGFAGNIRTRLRLSLCFGFFHFLMPVLGWLMGIGFVSYVKNFANWIAFFILFFIGIRMIWEALSKSDQSNRSDPFRGMSLIMLSLATSIDALSLGISLAILEVNILYSSLTISIITALMCLLSMSLGAKLGAKFGKSMVIIGGCVLIVIAGRILVS